ncbi:hypothetical protein RB213_004586 [Colletotrichum asianum]
MRRDTWPCGQFHREASSISWDLHRRVTDSSLGAQEKARWPVLAAMSMPTAKGQYFLLIAGGSAVSSLSK